MIENLPEKSDILFKEFNEDHTYNAIVRSGISNFFVYSEGYKEAGRKLFNLLSESDWQANILVYPILFLYRQYLELILKELIICLNIIKKEQAVFPGGHDLKQLWETYEALLRENRTIESETKEALKQVKRLLLDFHNLDPKSDGFRYPVNKEKEASFKLTNLDLKNFKQTMDKVIIFFEWQSDWLYAEKDQAVEYYGEMAREMEKEMMRDYEREMKRELASYYSQYKAQGFRIIQSCYEAIDNASHLGCAFKI